MGKESLEKLYAKSAKWDGVDDGPFLIHFPEFTYEINQDTKKLTIYDKDGEFAHTLRINDSIQWCKCQGVDQEPRHLTVYRYS